MPLTKLVTHHQFQYRGSAEDSTNGYTLDVDHDSLDDTEKIALIDAVVAIERSFHGVDVNFTKATIAPLGGDITHTRILSSAGLRTLTGRVRTHPEVCQMAEAALSSTRSLRKFYHVYDIIQFTLGDVADSADKVTTELVKLSNGTLPGGAKVCNDAGELPGAWSWDPYLRTHQFRAGNPRPPAA